MWTFKVVTLTMFIPLDPAVPFLGLNPPEILIQCLSHTIYMPSEVPSTSLSPTPGWCLLPLANTVECPSSPGAVQPLTPLPGPTASTETLVSWSLWIQMKPLPHMPTLHEIWPKGMRWHNWGLWDNAWYIGDGREPSTQFLSPSSHGDVLMDGACTQPVWRSLTQPRTVCAGFIMDPLLAFASHPVLFSLSSFFMHWHFTS